MTKFSNFIIASSTAVLVQLTPLLGALVGVVATLFLVAICIVIFVKFRSKVSRICALCKTIKLNMLSIFNDRAIQVDVMRQQQPNQIKEVLSHLVVTWEVIRVLVSQNEIRINIIYSHIFPEDKNPDVVPQENSDDEYTSEEKAFDRLTVDSHRIIYTPHLNTSPPSLSPSSFTAKPYGELSLTTNPAFALYNSPQRRPPQYTAPPLLSSSNIYTRIPTRAFTPYDTRTSPVSSNYGLTIPLLMQTNGTTLSNVDEKS